MNLFEFKTKIRRAFVKSFRIERPASHPFITGDGFRALAQHVLDEISDLVPQQVEENDIVFVRNDFLKVFFEKKQPLIKNKYILISTNDDGEIGEEYVKYIDDKILHWFGKNISVQHERMTPLPIGLTNYYHNYLGRGKISYVQKIIRELDDKIKKDKIAFGFFLYCNDERPKLYETLSQLNVAEKIDEKEQEAYFKKMSHYKLTVSPEGNGIDCHRTWEALYFRSIPIVKKSHLTLYFKDIGIPMILVNSFDEVKNFDAHFISEKFEEMRNGFNHPALYMNYWIDLILSKRIK